MSPQVSISVVTSAINAAGTIKDCVESVTNQSYFAQHVIVDGISVDGTLEISREYASPSATIISEVDRGPYNAINKGLALATGEVVGTLNANAFYPHNRVLSIVSQAFENPKVEACYGDLVYVDRDNPSRVVRYWKSRPFNKRLFRNGWMPTHPTFFVRRSVYDSLGTFNLELGLAADYELMLRFLVRHGVQAIYIPTLMMVVRSEGSSSGALTGRMWANRLDKLAWTTNSLRPLPWTFLAKPIRKIGQFLGRGPQSRPWLDDEWPSGDQGQVYVKTERADRSTSKTNKVPPKASSDIPFYVVTVNYRSEALLTRLIESLEPIHFLKKLIVVDHSESGSLQIPKCSFPVQTLSQRNIGYGGGLNRGLRQIREPGAIALLCNPDATISDPNELLKAINYLRENSAIGCLVPLMLNANSRPVRSWRKFYCVRSLVAARIDFLRTWYSNSPRSLFNNESTSEPHAVDWGSGSALLFKTSLFPYPICFDERFFLYFEDVDFCAQIWKAGLTVEFFPKLTCRHEGQMASHRSAYFLALHIGSLVKFILKYRGLPQREDLIRRSIR
jgi:GT2 family glycosyltransferase